MKRKLQLLFTLLLLGGASLYAQNFETTVHKDANGYSYESVSNDPLKARVYTLTNGLKVYLSVYKDEPRIQTYVAIKAGSKNDPAHATGLAHYLEHILFKGTSKIGTYNWEEEKKLVDQIEQVYEVYRQTKDTTQRKALYHKIDSLSVDAAKYAIANEYDKLLGGIGATGTNAYTFVEQTVYINNIPSNQLNNWAKIEAERFGEVVPRLFHTELEAVYEEKNKGLDSDRRQVWEQTLAGLFQKHPYGTQTTIGTIDHLQNPSITEIKKYFDKYYVPNNMAICMSGDLDPEKTIQIIDQYFGKLQNKEVPKFNVPVEPPITSPVVKEVTGPDAESVSIAFRFGGVHEKESLMMELISMILSNSQAGLIDINLNQQQKVLGAYSYPLRLKDYSMHNLAARPKEGQSLEEVKDLLLSQLELIKEGKIDGWLLEAIINDYKVSQMKAYQSNKNRADAFVTAFTSGYTWKNFVAENDQLSSISKEDIINFVKKHYKDNYVVIYKRLGEKQNLQKVKKPEISKVEVNREKKSAFLTEVQSQPVPQIQPVFLDYEKDVNKSVLKNNIPLLYQKNEENDLFQLYYIFDFGKDHDKEISLAIRYLNYLGTKNKSAEAIKQEFYQLGCEFDVLSGRDQVYVKLTGLNENFEEAVKLFETLLKKPVANEQAYNEMVERILTSRNNAKKNQRHVLTKGMLNYAKYGIHSPFRNYLSEKELKAIKPQDLCDKIKMLYKHEHRVLYYGPKSVQELSKNLNKLHRSKKKKLYSPASIEFAEQKLDSNIVYFVNFDMVQAQVLFWSPSVNYNKELVPIAKVYNEYFGGNMGSIVFQELREAQALAYAVRSYYRVAGELDEANSVISYIGTQADKLDMAITEMQKLLNDMPLSPSNFAQSKLAIQSSLETNRITKNGILFNYERAKKLGLEKDIRQDIYETLKTIELKDIKAFHEQYVKGQKQAILIIGSRESIDLKSLEKYGKVVELSLEDVFGY
ncbi:MAG: insulinase family protein [Cytophagales bacterium]|nr:insulinase family protein [Cytophagales bacterium]